MVELMIGKIQALSYVLKLGRGSWRKRGFSVVFVAGNGSRRREEYRVFRRLEPYEVRYEASVATSRLEEEERGERRGGGENIGCERVMNCYLEIIEDEYYL